MGRCPVEGSSLLCSSEFSFHPCFDVVEERSNLTRVLRFFFAASRGRSFRLDRISFLCSFLSGARLSSLSEELCSLDLVRSSHFFFPSSPFSRVELQTDSRLSFSPFVLQSPYPPSNSGSLSIRRRCREPKRSRNDDERFLLPLFPLLKLSLSPNGPHVSPFSFFLFFTPLLGTSHSSYSLSTPCSLSSRFSSRFVCFSQT